MERALTRHESRLQTQLARAARAKLEAETSVMAENLDGARQPGSQVLASTENSQPTRVAQAHASPAASRSAAISDAVAPVAPASDLPNRSPNPMVFAEEALTEDAAPNQAPQAAATDSGELARLLQVQLRRVGCYPIKINGEWNSQSRRALYAFNKHAGTKLDFRVANLEALDAVKARTSRICPLVCDHGYRAQGNTCVQIEKTSSKPAPSRAHRPQLTRRRPPSPEPAAVSPAPAITDSIPRSAAPDQNANNGKVCHTLAAHVFCQ
jgi:hypothetical protein